MAAPNAPTPGEPTRGRPGWRKVDSLAHSPAALVLGGRVRARREELGLSLEAAADKTVLHWSYIGKVERGAVNPTVMSVLRLADGLAIDAGDLLSGLHVPDDVEV